jgi:hypothetical protein
MTISKEDYESTAGEDKSTAILKVSFWLFLNCYGKILLNCF